MHGDDEARRAHLDDGTLSAYLDDAQGHLGMGERARAEAHLAACVRCREELAALATTRAMLHALPQVGLHRSFILTPELVAAGGGRRQGWQTPRWLWPTRWATAVAMLLFAFTTVLGMSEATDTTSVPVTMAATATTVPPLANPGIATCSTDPKTPDCLQIAGLTPTVFPTPTIVPAMGPVVPAQQAAAVPDWRTLQALSGGLALLGGICGFVLPAFWRRRGPSIR